MSLEYTTPVPNRVFDFDLAKLKEVELKVLMVVIRKTHGWVEQKNHRQRRQIQRITINTFELLTGSSRRSISGAIQSLIQKELIVVYDYNGKVLKEADDRKGKYHLYFKPNIPPVENHIPRQNLLLPYEKFSQQPKQNLLNTIKENMAKKNENINSYHISHHIKNYSL